MSHLVDLAGQRLEYRWIGPPPARAPTIVFLHEGLGCTGMWRDFPDRLASATGCGALVYSRRGYGRSEPVAGRRAVRFMHDEAIDVLPRLLEHFDLEDVVLFGHSDGASIALVYAGSATRAAQSVGCAVRGLVLEAPHVFIEDVCIESIRGIDHAYDTGDLRQRFARYHGDNTQSMFKSWTDAWLRPEFRQWNIEEYLPRVAVPVLVIQGRHDEYGTLKQVDSVVSNVRVRAESLILPDCGHSPHRDQPDAVLTVSTRFIRCLW